MKDNEINLMEYVYDQETMVNIPGSMLYALLQLLRQVVDDQTKTVFTSKYGTDVKEIYTEKLLEKVEMTLKDYPTATSFFNQTPVDGVSVLGAMAQDLLLLLQQGHLDNIKSGVAKQVGTFTPENKDGL